MHRILAIVLSIVLSVPVVAVVNGVPLDHVDAASADLLPGEQVLNATIVRDEWGVPHVYADDLYSLFYANGYAQAQDRLVQMEILRHVGKGELAKLTGPSGLEMDLVTRRELYTHAERQATYETLDPLWRDAFDAFSAGVNRWIDEVRADPAKLPVEYPALVAVPEAWAPTDTLAIAEYLLDVFGRGSGGGEVRNAQLLARLQDELGDDAAAAAAFSDLVWAVRNDTYTTIKPTDGAQWQWETLAQEVPHDLSDLSTLEAAQYEAYLAAQDVGLDDWQGSISEAAAAAGWPFRMGSNAQIVDGRFTDTGKPILYGGPQMAYFAPMIPYEVGLHGAGFDAVGMGVAGAPGVIIGRGPTHSWTVTSGSVDQVDMVAEKLVGDAYHYEVDGEVVEMDCRTETHLVRPGPAELAPASDPDWRPPLFDVVEQEVCRTIHGPVLARSSDGQYAFASHRSYRGDEARSGVLWLQLGLSRSITDIQDTLETFRFTFNFNIAEADGDIAYVHVGAQPIRDDRLDPRLPMPGWNSTYDWKGLLTGRDLPHMINPASGYSVNWNNNPARGWHTGDIFEKWGTAARAELMEELLLAKIAEVEAEGRGLTLDDVRAVNFDASTRDPYGDEFFALMRGAAVASGDATAVAAVDEWAATGYFYGGYATNPVTGDLIFGGAFGSTMPDGMRLFELWREDLQHRVFDDELDTFTRTFGWNPPETSDPHAADHGREDNKHLVLLHTLDGETSHNWCDDVATPAEESCQDQADAAMAAVLASGETWQDQPNRVSKFVALGALPAPTIPMTNRPSFQHFYDWGRPEGELSFNALPPGASGHLSTLDFVLLNMHAESDGAYGAKPAHLQDQLDLYVGFGDKPLIMDENVLAQHTESVTVLTG